MFTRVNDKTYWFASTLPGVQGNLGDIVTEEISWKPDAGGLYTPGEYDVVRKDVFGTFRMTIGPSDEVTNVPVLSFAFDVPEFLTYIPGVPVVVRATFQVTTTRGKLERQQSNDENEMFYIDLSPLFAAVENIASYAAIASPTIHRGVVVFRGVLKKLDVRPVLKVQLTSYFEEKPGPLAAYANIVIDYLFSSISSLMPVSTQEVPKEWDAEGEEDDVPFALRKGYLRFLLRSCQKQQAASLGLTETEQEFVFC